MVHVHGLLESNMKHHLMFMISLILLVPTQGFSAGSSSSDTGSNSNYSVTSTNPELKAAKAAINREEYYKAIDELNNILAKKPNHADAWNLLGFSARKSGDFKTAETAYSKALSINPKHTQAMEYMGEMYLSLNQPSKAEELLSRLEKLCTYNCKDRDLLKSAIKKYKATRS